MCNNNDCDVLFHRVYTSHMIVTDNCDLCSVRSVLIISATNDLIKLYVSVQFLSLHLTTDSIAHIQVRFKLKWMQCYFYQYIANQYWIQRKHMLSLVLLGLHWFKLSFCSCKLVKTDWNLWHGKTCFCRQKPNPG